MVLTKPQPTKLGDSTQPCEGDGCPSTVRYDDRMGFAIGIRHEMPDGTFSYIEDNGTPLHGCSHTCAVQAAHARIDALKSLAFGTYDPQKHNADGLYAHDQIKAQVEYSPSFTPPAKLPTVCALDSCGASLVGKEVYIPHVDYSTPQAPVTSRSHPLFGLASYQHVLQALNGGQGDLADHALGFCSLEHCIDGAHAIVDELLSLVPNRDNPFPTGQEEASHAES